MTEEQIVTAEKAEPEWGPEQELANDPRNLWCIPYGLTRFRDLFTPRQLVALTTFSDLVGEARQWALRDAVEAELPDDNVFLNEGGTGAQAYADAIATYLAFVVSKQADWCNSLSGYIPAVEKIGHLFSRQAIPMSWDFCEIDPLSNAAGNFSNHLNWVVHMVSAAPVGVTAKASQADATATTNGVESFLISTDPPYYDNIGYADLSDFFYVWLRHSLGKVYPRVLGTLSPQSLKNWSPRPTASMAVRRKAQEFFEEGIGRAFDRMREKANPDYPITVYYAFKQSESEGNGGDSVTVASTGWETMLEGLLATGFQITGTWPMRTERSGRSIGIGTNALASSVVLVCRPRAAEASPATRQEFVRALRCELPDALSVMMAENIAPVDLAQATIGPGMAIYSRYSKVVEADGSPMRVRTALQIINQALDEYLSEAEGDVDSHTRFAITWFEQHGMEPGPFGEAESIATARNVSVRGVQDAGILEARAGKVRLLPRESLAEGWDPATDGRLTDWEVVQYLIRALETEGETGAAALLTRIGDRGEGARDLAYLLYRICDRKRWAEEALAYNGLVLSWPEITRLASQNPEELEPQTSMDL